MLDSNLIPVTISAVSNRLSFTGRRCEPDLGGHFFRARYYLSDLGRFCSRDPVARGVSLAPLSSHEEPFFRESVEDEILKQTVNPYQYSGSAPLTKLDPTGLLFGWGYGNYCGWSRRGQKGPPVDALDAACKRHDKCQASWWTCNPYHLAKCTGLLCSDAIKARRFGCAQSHTSSIKRHECRKAAFDVIALFCPFSNSVWLLEP